MELESGKDRIISISEFYSDENKQDRLMSMKEWNQSKGEPTIRDLWDTINIDLASGVRFYDEETLEEYVDPKDIINRFIYAHIIDMANKNAGHTKFTPPPNLLIRFKSGCEKVDNMNLKEFFEWCEKNEQEKES